MLIKRAIGALKQFPGTFARLELLLVRRRGACENSCMRPSIPALLGAAGLCAGGGFFSWAAVAPSAQLFGPTLRHTGDPSAVALTFDDGPNPSVTPAILDLLDRHGASATFFQIGDHVRQFPALAKEVSSRGHSIGNHTATHPRLVFLSPRRIGEELERCALALVSATGRRTRWMRPPYGYRGPQLEAAVRKQDADLRVVMWSVSGCDWRAQPPVRIIKRLRRVKGGDIVLLHDGDHRTLIGDRSHTITALEYWLPRWRDAGMRFVGMDDLAGSSW
jgi:peptidoglycan/xylan/chitin deacetylase (PgdA/CDA1 family)